MIQDAATVASARIRTRSYAYRQATREQSGENTGDPGLGAGGYGSVGMGLLGAA